MASKIIISRIQHRRGLRENLPQPLLPGELALTTDTRQIWIGSEDLAPFGVRTFRTTTNVTANVNPWLTNNIASLVFDAPLSSEQFDQLKAELARDNLFTTPVPTPDPAIYYSPNAQVLWDGDRSVFVGVRAAELSDISPGTDLADELTTLLAGFSVSFVARMAVEEFPESGGLPAWQTDVTGHPTLLFGNPILTSRASGNVAKLVNLVSSATLTPNQYLVTLSNIELATTTSLITGGDFVGGPDILFAELIEPATQPLPVGPGSTGIVFDAEESDTIVIEYSLRGPGNAAVGIMTLILDTAGSNAPIIDDRNEVNSTGDFVFSTSVTGSNIELEYDNDTGESIVLKMTIRRWSSQ